MLPPDVQREMVSELEAHIMRCVRDQVCLVVVLAHGLGFWGSWSWRRTSHEMCVGPGGLLNQHLCMVSKGVWPRMC